MLLFIFHCLLVLSKLFACSPFIVRSLVLLSFLFGGVECGVGPTIVGAGQKLSIRPVVGPRFALGASVRLARVMRYALLDTLAVSARFCLKTEKIPQPSSTSWSIIGHALRL